MLYMTVFMVGMIAGIILWGVRISKPLRDALRVIAWGDGPELEAWLLKHTTNPELRTDNETLRVQVAKAILKKQRSSYG